MQWYYYVMIGAVLALLILPNVYFETKRKKQSEKLIKPLQSLDYKTFYKLVEDKNEVKYISPYNLEFIKLSAAIYQKKVNLIDEQCKKMESMNMTKKQSLEFYNQVLNYYITINDEKRATKYLDALKQVASEKEYEQSEMFYDIQIKKGYKYLDTLLETEKQFGDSMPVPLYYMIAKMYGNKGDKENEKKYLEKAEKKTKGK